jgi:hypothetical protein
MIAATQNRSHHKNALRGCGKTPGVGVLKGHGFPVVAEKLTCFLPEMS